MNVAELIEELSSHPLDAEVRMVWEGGARSVVSFTWLAKSGIVALAPHGESVYRDTDLPINADGAPLVKEDQCDWRTPDYPEENN